MTWGVYWQMARPRGRAGRDDYDQIRDSRRYYNYAMNLPYSQSTQDEEEKEEERCDSCSQASLSYSDDGQASTRSSNNSNYYRVNDRCKRHRLPDDTAKTEAVKTYKRRKPL